jgi:hypothetical protein
MSAIYQNATDSLRIGMEFFLKEESYSSRKPCRIATERTSRSNEPTPDLQKY